MLIDRESTKPHSSWVQPHLRSPEMTPSAVAPNGSTITSPLLEALSSNAFTVSSAQDTNEWARNVPAFSSSPGNLISLSDSPPTLPSSYDDKSTVAGWNQREHGIPNGQSSSTSPLNYRRRPLSFQMDNNLAYEDYQAAQKAMYPFRRSSMHSQQPHRYGSIPPLPHHPQPHFYGAPDPMLNIPPRASAFKSGTRAYYCGFDSLCASIPGASKHVDTVVVSGYEGGLDIWGISKSGLDKVASIDGLRGGVYNAKILPWTIEGETHPEFPLIVVVVHGPVWRSSDASSGDFMSETASVFNTESVRIQQHEFSASPSNLVRSITHYQTTVEVYSLKNKKHICSLLSVPQTPLPAPISSPSFAIPPPVGTLNISADAGNIVLSSGTTGEVWIYQQLNQEAGPRQHFRCIGKLWTTIQRVPLHDPTSSSEFTDSSNVFGEAQTFSQIHTSAIVSLKGRWLAYSPAPATSQVALRATVADASLTARAPGINGHAPPQPPTVNCAVDMPGGSTLLNRLSRVVAQSALSGAKWVGDQGVQAWNNYWSKPSVSQNEGSTAGQFMSGIHQTSQDPSQIFPPTHGGEFQRTTSNTESLVSILDLDKLAQIRTTSSGSSIHPLATFKAPLGCSFLSFGPSGLTLFTASSRGDYQFIWDLMRIQHIKSSVLQTSHFLTPPGQHVRQIAVFTRLTAARIVDVVWTMPHGERIAMITERSTVHVWDLPPGAFAWPPSRRRVKVTSPKASAGDISEVQASATAFASTIFQRAKVIAGPLTKKRERGASGSGGSGISAASMTAQAGQGGKAFISKSFGAATETIEHFRNSGENKLRLSQSTTSPSSSCIKWLKDSQKDSLAALVEGVVKIYTIKERRAYGDKHRISISNRHVDFRLPLTSDRNIAPVIMRAMDLDDELDLADKDADGTYWELGSYRPSAVTARAQSGTQSSIPQAEIESNAPYQPFHTDRRAGLYIYSNPTTQPSLPSVSALLTPVSITAAEPSLATDNAPWAFGLPVSSVKLNIGPSQVEEDDSSAIERVTTKISELDEQSEQIVVTTRRRRSPLRPDDADEAGFFEEDCEVVDYASQRV